MRNDAGTSRGIIVAIEGIDGSGTTTQAELLAEALRSSGREVVRTFEPSDGPIGRLIRDALTDEAGLGPAPLALLFAADRLEHLDRRVRPAVARGAVVLTDRSVVSSLAYQGLELPEGWVASINARAPYPDRVLWLDVPVETCLERIGGRGRSRDRYERRELLCRLHTRYAALAASDPRIHRIDGTPEEVHRRVLDALAGLPGLR